jgi:hypothetical protein
MGTHVGLKQGRCFLAFPAAFLRKPARRKANVALKSKNIFFLTEALNS